jgi:EAL domain-containing protein (putative c-di-GMP-specific phosphodiesterase class I)
LQIGEEAAARDAGGALRALRRLHDLGVRIAVDGFGTGRCPLSLLMGLRIDTARVGASFVRDLEGRPDRDALLGTIVGLGKLLDVGRIVAAGVDREEQRELLRAAGCHAIQGRLAGDPLTAAETADLLRT